ncbi:DUF721 domain-containing protein [Novosphingobium sp. FSY-8]|uniref:DUF721 domain-containing protein n=1 Tax=Novosphingobium ovatum TaxID=1908523 RepID=A0ABW9XBF6_9SPHN|nr:DUF721 domain-containing protein [Novosphingobium ovatum]NBC35851.1 DUF721 domain-containing protein [Novosphingobium ovatum]
MERDTSPRPGKTARSGKPRAAKASADDTAVPAAPAKKAAPKLYERPRGGQARAIADLMPDIGRSAFRRFGFVQSSVVTRWPEIIGPTHSRHCMPEAIRFPPGEKSDGILQLVVAPAHAPMISCIIPEIIDRVNRFFGYNAVAKVKMRQGQVELRPEVDPARPSPTAPPSLKPIPIELGDSLRDIGDPELKAVLESLARSMVAQEEKQK